MSQLVAGGRWYSPQLKRLGDKSPGGFLPESNSSQFSVSNQQKQGVSLRPLMLHLFSADFATQLHELKNKTRALEQEKLGEAGGDTFDG